MWIKRNVFDRSGEEGLRILSGRMETFPAQMFIPTRPAADLIRVIGTTVPKKRIFLMTSGNAASKTTTTIQILLNIVYPGLNLINYAKDLDTGEEFPGFFNYPLYQRFPKDWPTQAWYVSNKDALKSIDKKWRMWVNSQIAGGFKYDSQKLSLINFPGTKWQVQFKTIDQDPQTFETADVSVVVFDEPPPYRLFAAAVWRLRNGGIIIIPATPLFTAAWFVDEIIDKIKQEGEKSDMFHQKVSIYTNCIEKAGWWDLNEWGIQLKGNLWEENVEFMIKHMDPDEIEARRDGEFKYLTGLVYKIYEQPRTFLKDMLPLKTNPLYYAYRFLIDPHDRRPPAMYWERVTPNQPFQRYIMREWPNIKDTQYNGLEFHRIKDAGKYTIRDFVRIIQQIEKEELRIPDRARIKRIMDPNFGNKRDEETGKTTKQMYIDAAKEILNEDWAIDTSAMDSIDHGHKAVKELLKPSETGWMPLLLGPGCNEIDWALRHYSYEDLTPTMEERKEVTVKVKEIGKDFMDLLRYDAMIPISIDEFPIIRDPYEDRDYGDRTEGGIDRDWRFKMPPPRPDGVA